MVILEMGLLGIKLTFADGNHRTASITSDMRAATKPENVRFNENVDALELSVLYDFTRGKDVCSADYKDVIHTRYLRLQEKFKPRPSLRGA